MKSAVVMPPETLRTVRRMAQFKPRPITQRARASPAFSVYNLRESAKACAKRCTTGVEPSTMRCAAKEAT